MSIRMFALCAVAVVLLAPSADSQCSFVPGGNQCSTPWSVDKCVIGGVDALGACLLGEINSIDGVSTRVDALEEKQMTLMDTQDMIKEKFECVNRGGMLCAEDAMCYIVGGNKKFEDAKEFCEEIEGGELIKELPSPPAVENCLKLEENDLIWLDVEPTGGRGECNVSKVLADFTGEDDHKFCTGKNARRICKIII